MTEYRTKEEAEKDLFDPMEEAWCPIARSMCVKNCISRVLPKVVDVSTYNDKEPIWKVVNGYCTSPLVTGGIEITNMFEIRRYV